MAKTISELRNQSIQVRDASAAGENTATRVGTVLNDIVGHIEDYENTQSSNNSSQDAKIEGVKSSLNAEIARAKTEESNLSTQIGTERTERQAAVSREETARIQADNDEKTARQQADNAEQDARIKADNDEKTARENADITLRTMIQTEVSNRQIAVKQEEIRAKAAEQANTQAIADENARATTEEERLQGEIDNTNTKVETLENKVNSNHDHLTDEVARLDTADNEIKADLEAETARAKAAEEANATAIEDNATVMAGEVEKLNANKIENLRNYITVLDFNISDFFTRGYFNYNNGVFTPPQMSIDESTLFSCVSLPVKKGDVFMVNSLYGGSGSSRAYVIYNDNGEVLEEADKGVCIEDTEIRIENSGYIVFNNNNTVGKAEVIIKYGKIYLDYLQMYVAGLSKNINSKLTDEMARAKAAEEANAQAITDEITRAQEEEANIIATINQSKGEISRLDRKIDEYIYLYDVDVSYFFAGGYYYRYDGTSYKPSEALSNNSFSSLVLPVKKGDVFMVNSLYGGSGSSRAYVITDTEGNRLSMAEAGEIISNTEIVIEQAGYIIFTNTDKVGKASIIAKVCRLPLSYVQMYLLGIKDKCKEINNTFSEKIKDLSEKSKERVIRILCFGNSFTQDSMGYVPSILKNISPSIKLTLGIAYIGGCSLIQHLVNFSNEEQTLDNVSYSVKSYSLFKSIEGNPWTTVDNVSVDDLLNNENWDIITFQQNGGNAYREWDKYFAPYIYKLHKILFGKIGHNIKIGWLLTHGAYATSNEEFKTHWTGTVDNSKMIIKKTATEVIFPYGTAVQNLRTTSLVEIGDGSNKNLTADNVHLQEGIGCLSASLANALTIMKLVGLDYKGIISEGSVIDNDFITAQKIPGPHLGQSGVIGINTDNVFLAQVAALKAVENPFELTDLSLFETESII